MTSEQDARKHGIQPLLPRPRQEEHSSTLGNVTIELNTLHNRFKSIDLIAKGEILLFCLDQID